jgi:dTDP-4-dehydrorhamnose 3,5-epimerase
MHYQRPPHEETKLVSCVRGAIYDVIVDLRPASPAYLKWTAFELTADNGRMLYVPGGVAHGFQTLADDSDVAYDISQFYVPAAQVGVRYDDPAIGIRWPEPVSMISPRDAELPHIRADLTGHCARPAQESVQPGLGSG